MPVSLKDLREKQANDPAQYEKAKKGIVAFANSLYTLAQTVSRGEGKTDGTLGRKLRQYSDALKKVTGDPSDPTRQEEIDQALDTLVTLGDFLGGSAPGYSVYGNVCEHVTSMADDDGIENLRGGLRALNSFCGFNTDVDLVMDGQVIELSQRDRAERSRWQERRASERQEAERQARENARKREEERKRRIRQEQERKKREEEEEWREAEEKRRRAAEEEERRRQARLREEREAAEARKSEEQKAQERRDAIENVRKDVDTLLDRARDPKAPAEVKKQNLAQALASHREASFADGGEGRAVDMERLGQRMQTIYESAEFTIAEREGRLDELARCSAEELDRRVSEREAQVDRYEGGVEGSDTQAKKIFRQMDRTWRIRGNSAEYEAAKSAVQGVGGMDKPAGQLENYIAAQAVQSYVAKNLNEARSSVGMTRMACSLAFLKQTMSKAGFRAYCDGLNTLRGIKGTPGNDGKLVFDKTDPRCIEPDEIGTAKEVYATVRERFHTYATQAPDKMPPARDLAMLTALKNLAAKGKDGEDLVVEHEALQAEIEKVQNDRRFQDAMRDRKPYELIQMAWDGNLDALDGYRRPLSEEQQRLVKEEQERQDREKADREKAIEEERVRQEEEKKAEEERQKLREREERKNREKEAREQERREREKPLLDCYEDIAENVKEMGGALFSTYAELDGPEEQEKTTALFATAIALWECRDAAKKAGIRENEASVDKQALQTRVDELKNDPFVKEKAREARQDEKFSEDIRRYIEEGKDPKYGEQLQRIYPAVKLSKRLHSEYAASKDKKVEEDARDQETIADSYKRLKKSVDQLLDKGMDFRKAADVTALTLALREQEREGGLDAATDPNKLKTRVEELRNDKKVISIGQSLAGPTLREQITRHIGKDPDRVRSFAEVLDDRYQKLADTEKQREEEKGKEAVEKPQEMQGPGV